MELSVMENIVAYGLVNTIYYFLQKPFVIVINIYLRIKLVIFLN